MLRFGVIALLLTASAPRFEVAAIHPHDPKLNVSSMAGRGSEFSILGMPIRNLIWLAWHLPPERVIGGPKWLDSDLYDIRAKVPAGSSHSIDEQYRRIQTLFAERLQLKVHHSTREQAVYVLRVANTGLKMQQAKGSDPDAPEKGTILPWELFVTDLSRRVGRPVVDKTGLKGAWFVKLNYNSEDGSPAAIGTAREEGSPSIFTAVQQQLGLKLESTHGLVDVLVVDSVQRPSEN